MRNFNIPDSDKILSEVTNSLENKNKLIEKNDLLLKYSIKAFNDQLRVYEKKLLDFGIEDNMTGFLEIESEVSKIPCGLVAKNKFFSKNN